VPSRDPPQRFEDILNAIIRIEHHTAGIEDGAAFAENLLVYDAVERCLERISEAATKLGADAEQLCPGIPWPNIRGLGNILRHEYDNVEGFRLWYIVQDNLPPLKEAVKAALHQLSKTLAAGK
jgi:uncharacterized protein with HEPN domain